MGLKSFIDRVIAKANIGLPDTVQRVLDTNPFIHKLEDVAEDLLEMADSYKSAFTVLESIFDNIELKYFIAGLETVPFIEHSPLAPILTKLKKLAEDNGEETFSSEDIAKAQTTDSITPSISVASRIAGIEGIEESELDPILTAVKTETEKDIINTSKPPPSVRSGFTYESPPKIDIDAINDKIIIHSLVHIGITITIATIQVIAEVGSAGLIDEVLAPLSAVYNLFPSQIVYNQMIAVDTELNLMRSYKYMKEAESLSLIPPISDIIMMTGKEQFGKTPQDNLDEMIRLLKMHGIHPFFANAYWGSHWDLPNTNELFSMFGRDIIDKAKLEQQLQINDIHPDWIQPILELSERFPSRTEARLINRVRKMDQSLIDRILKNERIHPDFLEDYSFFLNNQELDTIKLQTAKVYQDQYERGFITVEEFTDHLKDSPYSEIEKVALIKMSNERVITDIKKLNIDSIKRDFAWKFKQGSADIQDIRLEVAKIVRHPELADSIGDNIASKAKTDFSLSMLEALEEGK